jgi:hypothetical protein
MALVGEAGRQRDLGQGRVFLQEPAGPLDSQPAEVLAQSAAVIATERAGQVPGVYTGSGGNRS